MFLKIIHNSVFILNSATIVSLAKVFHLPRTIDFFGHGIVKVAIEQKNIIFIESVLAQLRSNVFLGSLRFRKHNNLLRNTLFFLILKSRMNRSFQGFYLGITLDTACRFYDRINLINFSLYLLLLKSGILIIDFLKTRFINFIFHKFPE